VAAPSSLRAAPRAASAWVSEPGRTVSAPHAGLKLSEVLQAPVQRPALQRLKTRAQFQVATATRPVSRTTHFVLHRTALGLPGDLSTGADSVRRQALFAVQAPWLGAVVPKRWARRAVTRNTIKRQIYAVAQDFASQLPAAAHVVRLRAGFDRVQFSSATSESLKRAVRAELQQLFAGAPC